MEQRLDIVTRHFNIIEEGVDDASFISADKLGEIGGLEVIEKLITLLSTSTNQNTQYLAARALSKCEGNNEVIAKVFELIKNTKDSFLKSVLTEALSGFDCSEYFVEVFKLFLFGSLKVSAMAKEVLDDQEFAITPRVIRKSEKHFKHYLHNISTDEMFSAKKFEIEEMLSTMKELFEDEDFSADSNED